MAEERLARRGKPSAEDTTCAGDKAIASLLIKWAKCLINLWMMKRKGRTVVVQNEGKPLTAHRGNRRKEVFALVGAERQGRIALAIEALWDEVEPISDWEGLLDLLLLNHSAIGEGTDGRSMPRARTKGRRAVMRWWWIIFGG